MAEMSDDRFWELVGRTTVHEAESGRRIEALRTALGALTPAEIEGFENAFIRAQQRSYSWDLWGAAYLVNGGASDDGFEYFRRWLISKGRTVFEAAVADPDSLAGLLPPDFEGDADFEEFGYVAGDVWAQKTGRDLSSFPYTGAQPAPEPSGEPFDEDAEHLARRYPKLWARFGF